MEPEIATKTSQQLTAPKVRGALLTSGVVDEHTLNAWTKTRPKPFGEVDGKRMLEALVRDDLLTRWQAKFVAQDKAEALVFGNYVLLDKLGEGGMGLVFKAIHRGMDRVVALKTLHKRLTADRDTVQRFRREVIAAARLSHPNIVTAFDAGEARGLQFLVTEFVDGEDIGRLIVQNGPTSVLKAIEVIIQAARGLEHAHEHGIVHRDVKPSNLLIDRKGQVRILDMGLARIDTDTPGDQENQLTQAGRVMGTIDYMAPEQAADSSTADARADIYSLGSTLFFLLNGKPPYEGASLMNRMLAHRDNPIPLLLNRDGIPVSESLQYAVRRMLAKTPDERYQSAGECIADLREVLTETSASLGGDEGAVSAFDAFKPEQPTGLLEPGPIPSRAPVFDVDSVRAPERAPDASPTRLDITLSAAAGSGNRLSLSGSSEMDLPWQRPERPVPLLERIPIVPILAFALVCGIVTIGLTRGSSTLPPAPVVEKEEAPTRVFTASPMAGRESEMTSGDAALKNTAPSPSTKSEHRSFSLE